MDINIRTSKINFKNPNIGQQTMPIEQHYNGRRIMADVNGEERVFNFKKDELAFNIDEDDMVSAILQKVEDSKRDAQV